MHLMKKTIALLVLTTAITGCQSSKPCSMDEESLTALRCWHFRDQNPITKEHVAYIRKQSKRGNLACKTILGHMYERGLGMPVDIAKAKAIYQALADADESAYLELGRLAEEGIGEPVDYVKARELYERAAKNGNNAAASKLGVLMEQGKGGPRDLDGALTLYLGSVRLYGDEAWRGIQRLRKQGVALSIEQKNKCNKIWRRAFNSMFSRAISNVEKQLTKETSPQNYLESATVKLTFSVESDTPDISIAKSSGDPITDQKVLNSISGYRFHGGPMLPDNQKTWAVSLIFPLREESAASMNNK